MINRNKVFFSCSLLLSLNIHAGTPTQFSSIETMIEEFNDFSVEEGTFKIIKKNPLHIQLSPKTVPNDLPQNITDGVDRALVYGVYRTFAHTKYTKITVTAIPKETDLKTLKSKLLDAKKKTITIDRINALTLAKKYLQITDFSDLITETKKGNYTIKNTWTDNFKKIYYNDSGSPGLTKFVQEISMQYHQ